MIAVSIQFSNCFAPSSHLALPPLSTNDFQTARKFADKYMQAHFPSAVNVTYHLMRDDWVFESTLGSNQEAQPFSLN